MKVSRWYSNVIEWLDFPTRLVLSLALLAAAFAAEFQSSVVFGLLALMDLVGVVFGLILFRLRSDTQAKTLLSTLRSEQASGIAQRLRPILR